MEDIGRAFHESMLSAHGCRNAAWFKERWEIYSQMVDVERLATDVGKHYLESEDFNGYPVRRVASTIDERRRLARALIEQGLAVVNFGDRHPN